MLEYMCTGIICRTSLSAPLILQHFKAYTHAPRSIPPATQSLCARSKPMLLIPMARACQGLGAASLAAKARTATGGSARHVATLDT
jgi:hypothetical protein